MEWIQDLLFNSESVAHAILIYALVIAFGVALGKVKILGVSLGVTFVLFVGLLIGHFGFSVNGNVIKFVQDFGLILFIFSIGMQVGPGFFSSFKKGGFLLNGLAILIITLNIAVALTIYYTAGNVSLTDMVGILSGAVTNTPGLGAAQQTLTEIQGDTAAGAIQGMSMGYAAAYPLGVVGIILSMILIKSIFKIKLEDETKKLEEENAQSQLMPYVITLRAENSGIFNKSVKEIHDVIGRNFVISRMLSDGKFTIPTSSTIVKEGDLLLIVISVQDEAAYTTIIGPKVEHDWEVENSPVVSRRIVVTNSDINGKKLGTMRLHAGFRLNVTRINRAGVDLLASPNLALQMGDRLTVVGNINDIERFASKLGNSLKRLNEPNMFTMFIGIFLGIVIGSIPFALPGMSVPMKLGLAGGPLIVAILLSRFGHNFKVVTYTSSAANLLLREVGICLFLASVGISAGAEFADTVFNSTGAMWVLYGFLITFIPLVIVGFIARAKFNINYYTIMGLLSGGTTDPPALAYANKTANNDAPAVSYSTVYPLTMFLRVITAQLIILFLA
ncbi:MAG: putative transporter [Muribaculaceae bacterium]|nr:putative transporter [Muribaculaceae bacterium]